MNWKQIFIEIVDPKKSNIIVGVIYRSMDLPDFDCNYLNKQLDISEERQSIFLLRDFNVNLLNYTIAKHNLTNKLFGLFILPRNFF